MAMCTSATSKSRASVAEADVEPKQHAGHGVPERVAVAIPVQQLQAIAAARAKHEDVVGLRILAGHFLGLLGQRVNELQSRAPQPLGRG